MIHKGGEGEDALTPFDSESMLPIFRSCPFTVVVSESDIDVEHGWVWPRSLVEDLCDSSMLTMCRVTTNFVESSVSVNLQDGFLLQRMFWSRFDMSWPGRTPKCVRITEFYALHHRLT